MGVLSAWVSSTSADVSLLARAYLPEFLLITLLVVLTMSVRRLVGRDRRSPR